MFDIKESDFFKGAVVSIKRAWDNEWLLIDSKSHDILLKGSKEQIMEQYDKLNI